MFTDKLFCQQLHLINFTKNLLLIKLLFLNNYNSINKIFNVLTLIIFLWDIDWLWSLIRIDVSLGFQILAPCRLVGFSSPVTSIWVSAPVPFIVVDLFLISHHGTFLQVQSVSGCDIRTVKFYCTTFSSKVERNIIILKQPTYDFN